MNAGLEHALADERHAIEEERQVAADYAAGLVSADTWKASTAKREAAQAKHSAEAKRSAEEAARVAADGRRVAEEATAKESADAKARADAPYRRRLEELRAHRTPLITTALRRASVAAAVVIDGEDREAARRYTAAQERENEIRALADRFGEPMLETDRAPSHWTWPARSLTSAIVAALGAARANGETFGEANLRRALPGQSEDDLQEIFGALSTAGALRPRRPATRAETNEHEAAVARVARATSAEAEAREASLRINRTLEPATWDAARDARRTLEIAAAELLEAKAALSVLEEAFADQGIDPTPPGIVARVAASVRSVLGT